MGRAKVAVPIRSQGIESVMLSKMTKSQLTAEWLACCSIHDETNDPGLLSKIGDIEAEVSRRGLDVYAFLKAIA